MSTSTRYWKVKFSQNIGATSLPRPAVAHADGPYRAAELRPGHIRHRGVGPVTGRVPALGPLPRLAASVGVVIVTAVNEALQRVS